MQIFLAPIVFAAIWSFVAPVYHLPSLKSIILAIFEMIESGTYFHDIMVSSIRGLSGFFIGFLSGVLFGVITGKIKNAFTLLGGLFLFLRWTPVLALLPITIRVGGIGENPKVFLIAWACFFISWTYTHASVSKLNPEYLWWSKSLGLNTTQRLFKVYIPAIAPSLIGGARVGIAIAMVVVVAAELGGTLQDGFFRDGLGYRISRAIETSRNDINIACILTFGFIGVFFDFLLLQFIKHPLQKITHINYYRNDD